MDLDEACTRRASYSASRPTRLNFSTPNIMTTETEMKVRHRRPNNGVRNSAADRTKCEAPPVVYLESTLDLLQDMNTVIADPVVTG